MGDRARNIMRIRNLTHTGIIKELASTVQIVDDAIEEEQMFRSPTNGKGKPGNLAIEILLFFGANRFSNRPLGILYFPSFLCRMHVEVIPEFP